MPINKVPVVHKFGIISYSQRLELQERLLKQSFPEGPDSKQSVIQSTRKPLEISEEFIRQYNNTSSLDEKEKYEDLARKILERIKRRSGIRVGSEGQHVNLPLAWTELSQLAQCKGTIQEDCLDVLIVSLDQAPLESYHIPALFFLAETMLYWLRTDVIHQPFLRTAELKLLRMGQLVFTRLFYHHMAGELQGEQHFKTRLFTYLDGLRDCQDAYNPYPNALLSLRFVIEVGKIILSDVHLDPEEVREADQSDNRSTKSPTSASRSGHSLPTPPETPRKLLSTRSSGKPEATVSDQSANSGGLSTSIHSLSPSLWHSLDVWRCTNHLSGGLSHALSSLARCGTGLANESWIDSSCSMLILAEAAKTRACVLKAMQSIAIGQVPEEGAASRPTSSRSQLTDVFSMSTDDLIRHTDTAGSAGNVSSKPSLSDIFERSDEGDSHSESKTKLSDGGSDSNPRTGSERSSASRSGNRRQSHQLHKQTSQEGNSKNENRPDRSPSPNKEVLRGSEDVGPDYGSPSGKPKPSLKTPNSSLKPTNAREVSFDDGLGSGSGQPPDSRKALSANQKSEESLAAQSHDTSHKPEAGTAEPSGRDSRTSSVPTYTNQPPTSGCGLDSWHWETAIMYTEMMASVCLYGNSSLIQKRALMGGHSDLSSAIRRGRPASPLQGASLLDLIRFKSAMETTDGGHNDWSWRVRYGAIQSLVKICRCLSNDKPREGLRNIAWAALMHAHSTEKDDRVLEALKVGEVFSSLEKLCSGRETPNVRVLGGRLAAGLAKIYLPPLPPPVEPPSSKATQPRRSRLTGSLNQPVFTSQPLRTSVREEIDLASAFAARPPDFNSRTSFDLRRIVEDQWRKELQTVLDDDETERRENLAANQKEEEIRQRRLAVNKSKKFDQKTVSV